MKKIIAGLVLGLVLSASGFYFSLPKIKQTSYDQGYAVGNKEGLATGTTAGIAQGVDQVNARIKHDQDIAAEAARKRAAQRKVAAKPKEVEKPVQNWHVIDGKIAEPVKD
jgi:hypothetical protein